MTTNSRPRSCRGGLIISGAGGSCPCRLQWLQNSQYVRLLQARHVQHWRPQIVHFEIMLVSLLYPLYRSRGVEEGGPTLRARDQIARSRTFHPSCQGHLQRQRHGDLAQTHGRGQHECEL